MLEVVSVGVAHITKRDKMRLFYGRSLGSSMPNDQDSYMTDDDLQCYAVADGTGGSANSKKASEAVVEEYRQVIRDLYTVDISANTTHQAYVTETLRRINAVAADVPATTTFTGMAVHPNNTASYLHVGDSQLLLYRHGELVHCTSEHVKDDGNKLLNYLGTQLEWAARGYGRHALSVTVQPNSFSVTKMEAEWGEILLQDGDRFALVTDGILGSGLDYKLDERIIKQCLSRQLGATACADALLVASRKEDDSTVVIVDIGQNDK